MFLPSVKNNIFWVSPLVIYHIGKLWVFILYSILYCVSLLYLCICTTSTVLKSWMLVRCLKSKQPFFHWISYKIRWGEGVKENYIFLSFTSLVDNVTCPCIFSTDLYTITIVGVQDNVCFQSVCVGTPTQRPTKPRAAAPLATRKPTPRTKWKQPSSDEENWTIFVH